MLPLQIPIHSVPPKCINHPNTFRYVCGSVTTEAKRLTVTPDLRNNINYIVSILLRIAPASGVYKPFLLAQDDGTDTEFQNVGLYTSDAGEIPKRILTTFQVLIS